jgi:hypothetical protein
MTVRDARLLYPLVDRPHSRPDKVPGSPHDVPAYFPRLLPRRYAKID